MKKIHFVSRPYFSEQGNVDDDATFVTIFLVSFNCLAASCSLRSAVCGLRSAVCSLQMSYTDQVELEMLEVYWLPDIVDNNNLFRGDHTVSYCCNNHGFRPCKVLGVSSNLILTTCIFIYLFFESGAHEAFLCLFGIQAHQLTIRNKETLSIRH